MLMKICQRLMNCFTRNTIVIKEYNMKLTTAFIVMLALSGCVMVDSQINNTLQLEQESTSPVTPIE